MFGPFGKEVVSPHPQGREEAAGNSAVGTVRGEQGNEASYAEDNGNHHHAEHGIAQHVFSRRITVSVTLGFFAEPRKAVLHDAEGAYNRAIKAPEKQGQHNQRGNHPYVEGEQGGKKLYLGHPAEPRVHRSRKVEEQRGNGNDTENGKRTSNISQHKESYWFNVAKLMFFSVIYQYKLLIYLPFYQKDRGCLGQCFDRNNK